MPDAFLQLAGVNLWRGGSRILQDVTAAWFDPGMHALVGPNGAGKSSLLQVIGGQWRAQTGSVELLGQSMDRLSVHQRAQKGLARAFQQSQLFGTLTVYEHLQIARPTLARSEIETALEQAGLQDQARQQAQALSYAEQRRLDLLMAIVQRPRVLLLDEPTAGLSTEQADALDPLLEPLLKDCCVLVVEHDLEWLTSRTQSLAWMAEARLHWVLPLREALSRPEWQHHRSGHQEQRSERDQIHD